VRGGEKLEVREEGLVSRMEKKEKKKYKSSSGNMFIKEVKRVLTISG